MRRMTISRATLSGSEYRRSMSWRALSETPASWSWGSGAWNCTPWASALSSEQMICPSCDSDSDGPEHVRQALRRLPLFGQLWHSGKEKPHLLSDFVHRFLPFAFLRRFTPYRIRHGESSVVFRLFVLLFLTGVITHPLPTSDPVGAQGSPAGCGPPPSASHWL